MFFLYLIVFFSSVLLSHPALILDDTVLDETYWCSNPRCCLIQNDTIWDEYGYNHTNQCETDSDCIYHNAILNNCGLPEDLPWFYVAGSSHYCLEMGELGNKYCTIGCNLYAPDLCSDPDGSYDSVNGVMHYCYFYWDNVTEVIVPNCPCFLVSCGDFELCVSNPIQSLPPP